MIVCLCWLRVGCVFVFVFVLCLCFVFVFVVCCLLFSGGFSLKQQTLFTKTGVWGGGVYVLMP